MEAIEGQRCSKGYNLANKKCRKSAVGKAEKQPDLYENMMRMKVRSVSESLVERHIGVI